LKQLVTLTTVLRYRAACDAVGDISTSRFDGDIATSGYLSMSHLFVDTFFDLGVVENFVYRARITVILILQIYSAV